MRAKRVKALNRLFTKLFGRTPLPTQWKLIEGGRKWEIHQSEIRKFRKQMRGVK